MKPQFYAKDRTEWRSWLKKHGTGTKEIWLVFYKKHTGRPCLSYDEAVEEALCYGWIDSIKRSIDEDRYAFKITPRKKGSKWSPSNIKRAKKLIREGRMTRRGLILVEAAKASGAWDNPVRPPTFAMPDELRKALSRNAEAGGFFYTLPPSQKKLYIAWIASAKRLVTREKRLKEAIILLKAKKRLGMI